MTDSRWLLEVTEYLLDRCERLGVRRSSCSAQEFKLSRSGLLRFSGQVAVGMGFQTVVAGRSIWFRRSLSWVQPVALPHVQSNDNRKSPLLITLHVNALSYLLVTVAHYCVPAKGR